jgi:FkbM family methyltransferase
VDIGANPIDGEPPYKVMLEKGLCDLTGFEPQEAGLAKLNALKGPRERYLPFAVGDGTRGTLNVCHAPGMTSLLKPDPDALAMLNLFATHGYVVENVDVETRRLDDIDEIQSFDLLKIDVQGSELSIFRNGLNKLRSAVAIQTEVSFVTLYQNQPPFGEIDLELRRQGFIPHCFVQMRNRGIAPIVLNGSPRVTLNQLVEADIVYVRDFSKSDCLSNEQLQHLALIAHYCYASYDLAAFCLHVLAKREGSDLDERYFSLLTESGLFEQVEIGTAAAAALKSKVRLSHLLSRARAHHLKGELAEAEKLYRDCVEVEPDNIDVLTLLGTLCAQKGDLDQALRQLERSLNIDPEQSFALNSIGNVFNSLGRHAEALAAFDRALVLKPGQAATYNNRGTALRGLSRAEEALASIDQALSLNPEYAEAFHNRGLALDDLRRWEESLESHDRALTLKPAFADAHRNRGNTLRGLKRYGDALASYDRALVLSPDFSECYLDKGLALQENGDAAQAVGCYERAIALKSSSPAAYNNAGNALAMAHRHEEAIVNYQKAIALRRNYAEAYYNLGLALRALNQRSDSLSAFDDAIALKPGYAAAHLARANLLRDMRRHSEAFASYDQALELEPACADAHSDRALALVDLGRHMEALAGFDRALECNPELTGVRGFRWGTKLAVCDWNGLESEAEALRSAIGRGVPVSTPFSFMTVPCGPELQRKCAEAFVQPARSLRAGASPSGGKIEVRDRIRMAYVSADYRNHATSFLAAGIFEHHDRTKFEIHGISFGQDDRSPMRERVKGGFEHFVDAIAISDRAVATLLRERRIDIAVDLMGFTKDARMGIFAFRPAPIQVNYLGNPGTTGADYFDYIIADRVIIPESEQHCYSEKVTYMPYTYQCNDSKRGIGQTPARSAAGLPDDGFVFCSFNRTDKITPEFFNIWMRLLRETQGSVLWLLQSNPTAAQNLRHHAKTRGIAADRIVFAPPVSNADHLARHHLADLFLDTLPYGAHTTASDALWMGLPVLTCRGNTFPGRVAASLLEAVGLPELVTASLAEYEALALDLARNPTSLGRMKSKLLINRESHPLFDTARFTRDLERAYEVMVERHRNGLAPEAFAVELAGGSVPAALRH